jgi:hypothetical protein
MHGNVCEWCRDHYVEKLPGGRDAEVKAEPSGGMRLPPPQLTSFLFGLHPLPDAV